MGEKNLDVLTLDFKLTIPNNVKNAVSSLSSNPLKL